MRRRRRQQYCRRGTHSQALRHGRQFRSMSCARRGCRKPEKRAASLSYAPGRRALARARFTPHSRTPRCFSTGGSEGVRGGKACDSTASRFKTSRHSKRLNCGPRSTSRPAAPKPLDNWRRPARRGLGPPSLSGPSSLSSTGGRMAGQERRPSHPHPSSPSKSPLLRALHGQNLT